MAKVKDSSPIIMVRLRIELDSIAAVVGLFNEAGRSVGGAGSLD